MRNSSGKSAVQKVWLELAVFFISLWAKMKEKSKTDRVFNSRFPGVNWSTFRFKACYFICLSLINIPLTEVGLYLYFQMKFVGEFIETESNSKMIQAVKIFWVVRSFTDNFNLWHVNFMALFKFTCYLCLLIDHAFHCFCQGWRSSLWICEW